LRFARSLIFSSLFVALVGTTRADTVFEHPRERKSLSYHVVIDEHGQLKSAVPLDVSAGWEVVRAGIAAIKQVGFEPATVDGQPAETETNLHLVVHFARQSDGSYRTELVSARLGPMAVKGTTFKLSDKLPASAIAVLVVAVAVREDGSVDAVHTRILQTATSEVGQKYVAQFEQSTLETLRDWQFEPDRVGNRLVASEAEVISRFCTTDCTRPLEPVPSAEREALPRSLTPGVQLARLRTAEK
jgi:hypothetical protein